MQPFYVGQKVVALTDSMQYPIKKGQVFIVKGLKEPCCNDGWMIDIGIIVTRHHHVCGRCSTILSSNSGIAWRVAHQFVPLQENFEPISFFKIMEEELTSVN